eukprot:1844179-Prymnesium_polylepis.1
MSPADQPTTCVCGNVDAESPVWNESITSCGDGNTPSRGGEGSAGDGAISSRGGEGSAGDGSISSRGGDGSAGAGCTGGDSLCVRAAPRMLISACLRATSSPAPLSFPAPSCSFTG